MSSSINYINDDNNQLDKSEVDKFDTRLPVSHSYLNSNEFGEISAETFNFLEFDKEIKVPLIATEAVLLPGQSLALKFNHRESIIFIQKKAKKYPYFCFATIDYHFRCDFNQIQSIISHIGTLFQIKNLSVEDNHLTIQAIGRERCKICSIRNCDAVYYDDYYILANNVSVLILDDMTILPTIYSPDLSFNKLSKKLKTLYCSSLFYTNSYAIEHSSTEKVIYWIKNWLTKWYELSRINIIIEQGYTAFSYWVAANLPIDLDTKLLIYKTECSNRRLQVEWNIISQLEFLKCIQCDTILINVNDVINLSVEGNGMLFVNPGGIVFDIFTVSKIYNAEVYGTPCSDFSWYPNYYWVFLKCSECSLHIGWYYTSSKYSPKSFYGIIRKSIKLAIFEKNDL